MIIAQKYAIEHFKVHIAQKYAIEYFKVHIVASNTLYVGGDS